MSRTYTLKRRAEQQAETRKKIVEAAVELHSTIGPAQTSVSMVAERAGVQRHTFYAHFPDELSLLGACSTLVAERDPLPDAARWREIGDGRERLRTGLRELYGWYERNAGLLAAVLRDREHHAPTRQTSDRQFGPVMTASLDVLGAGLNARQRPLLHLALSFHTWRTLREECGLTPSAAVTTMVQAIDCAGKARKASQ